MQKISVTRALVELKRLNDKITTAAQQTFVGRSIGKNNNLKMVGVNQTKEAFEAEAVANMQKVTKLIENREALKSAIVISNATTKVNVAGREMSVAEAIELKTSVAFKEVLLSNLRHQLNTQKNQVDISNTRLEEDIQKLINTHVGADKSKVDQASIEVLTESQKKLKEQTLVDPCNCEKLISKLQEEINVVRSELDFILSESNSRTEISVEL